MDLNETSRGEPEICSIAALDDRRIVSVGASPRTSLRIRVCKYSSSETAQCQKRKVGQHVGVLPEASQRQRQRAKPKSNKTNSKGRFIRPKHETSQTTIRTFPRSVLPGTSWKMITTPPAPLAEISHESDCPGARPASHIFTRLLACSCILADLHGKKACQDN